MASYTAVRAVHKTLTGTTVDTVTLTGEGNVDVLNRAAPGGADMYVTFAGDGTTPTNPVALADDTEIIPPGGFITFTGGANRSDRNSIVKVVGNGNAYSVIGLP